MTNEKAVEILQAEVDKAIDDKEYMANDLFDAMCAGVKALEQEPKTGHWIQIYLGDAGDVDGKCSECGFIHKFIDGHTAQYNYCPNCGAKMKGAE